jgi:diguanylate cyclase (GGDEF)-like protein
MKKSSPAPKKVSMALILDRLKKFDDEMRAARERISHLEEQIETDPLLNILNRRGFERELNRALAHVKRYRTTAGLIFIDLNNFKATNDRYGHLAGDAILKAVATVLDGHTRASDVVGRFGGDEFVLLLWNAGEKLVRAKAQEHEATIAALEVPFAGKMLRVGATAGVAMLAADDTATKVVERADADMYSGKAAKPAAIASPRSRPRATAERQRVPA